MRLGALYICFFFVCLFFFPTRENPDPKFQICIFLGKKTKTKKQKNKQKETNRNILQQSALQIRVFNCAMNAVWQRHTRADKAFFQLFSGFQ